MDLGHVGTLEFYVHDGADNLHYLARAHVALSHKLVIHATWRSLAILKICQFLHLINPQLTAAAPAVISANSLVIAACRALL